MNVFLKENFKLFIHCLVNIYLSRSKVKLPFLRVCNLREEDSHF